MKSIKDLGASLGILASGTFANLVIGLTQGVLTARLLGLEDYGRFASLLAFATIVAKLNDLGMPHAYAYFYRRSPLVLPTLLRLLALNFLWCCCAAALIVGFTSLVPLPFVPIAGFAPWALMAFGVLMAIGTPLNILISTAMATGNYVLFATLNSATGFLQIVLLLLFAGLGMVSLELFILLVALAQTLVVVYMAVRFVRTAQPITPDQITVRKVLGFGLSTQWGVLLKQLSVRFELLFVAAVLSPAEAGMYSLALSVRDAGLMPQSIYSAPLQNLIIDRNKAAGLSDDRLVVLGSIMFQLGLSTAMTLAAAIALPLLIPALYGQAYSSAVMPAIILFSSVIFVGAAGICWVVFNAKGRPHHTSLTLTITGLPAPFVIYYAALHYGLLGASIASACMAFLTFITSFIGIIYVQRYSLIDVRAALVRTPPFLSSLLRVALAQLRP